MATRKLLLTINGAERLVVCDPEETLAQFLRRIGLTGVKVGCAVGQCGICSVILDGKVIRACVKKMKGVPDHSTITTIEGIGTPANLHPLQKAMIMMGGVQCGICSPGFIVSGKALLDSNPNPTRQEVREWFQKNHNLCRCTGYKQIVDAVMAAAKILRGEMTMEDLDFKMPANGSLLGTMFPRPAALAKVTGTCDYGTDINEKMLPGSAYHMGLAQSKVSHAKVLNIDISEAEKMPGVVKVVTHKDVKGNNKIFSGTMGPRITMDGFDRRVFVESKVHQYGEIYAVVLADTRANARAAAEKVKVDLELLPEYVNGLDAVQPGAVSIYPEYGDNLYGVQPIFKGEDTEKIFAESDFTAEGSYYSSRQPHVVLEPDTVMAYKDENGLWAVQCKSLALGYIGFMCAGALGIGMDEIRPIENPTGASFGYSMSVNTYAAALASTMAMDGFPVCLDLDYPQQTYTTGKRSPSYHNIKMSANKDGKITGLEFESLFDQGSCSETAGIIMEKDVRFLGYPYVIPNIKGVSMVTFTNNAFTTAFRGFGSPQAYTASEQLMDELAEKIGMDPFEFRYRNVYRPGDVSNTGNTFSVYPMVELMDRMRPKYEAAKARAKAESTPDKKRGVGISCGGYNVCGGPDDFAIVALELNPDGTVTNYNSWEDQGQGGDVGMLVQTFEALRPLGLKPEQIKLVSNDLGICPLTGAAAASRSHYMAGNAVIIAASDLVDAMRKSDGTYRTYDEMKAEGIETKYEGLYGTFGQCTPLNPNNGQGNPTPEYNFAVFMTEVEVDTKTGKTTVLKVTAECDIGTVGSKQACDGQGFGGLAQGIGLALSEHFDDPKKDLYPLQLGIPQILDIPDDMEINYLETPRPTGPFGSSGMSEMFLSANHVSVLNAIKNACGVRVGEIPATPDKVLAGIQALEKGQKPKQKKYFLGKDFDERIEEIKTHPVEAGEGGVAM